MRIKAKVPSVLGETDTGWCMPCVPYAGPGVGFAFLPETGSGVWIEFEGGDVSFPIWVGGYWRQGEFPADAADHVKVIVTKAPHKFEFERRPGLDHALGPERQHGDPGQLGHHARQRPVDSVVVSSSSVSVNDGALEVQ